ncbi:hypothetical protein D3C80_1813630 [compost metagenome]
MGAVRALTPLPPITAAGISVIDFSKKSRRELLVLSFDIAHSFQKKSQLFNLNLAVYTEFKHILLRNCLFFEGQNVSFGSNVTGNYLIERKVFFVNVKLTICAVF